jgi:hypothetical protein
MPKIACACHGVTVIRLPHIAESFANGTALAPGRINLLRVSAANGRRWEPPWRLPRGASTNDVGLRMSDLTQVELIWLKKRIENWIRFGRIAQEAVVDRNRRIVSFTPGSLFAFVRWAGNDYGTAISRIDILRALTPGEACSTVPYVRPGGQILLRLAGWPTVERVLQTIDAVEALGINPADAAPEYWRHVHNRLSVNEKPRRYTQTRHSAWLLRRAVAP